MPIEVPAPGDVRISALMSTEVGALITVQFGAGVLRLMIVETGHIHLLGMTPAQARDFAQSLLSTVDSLDAQ